MRQAGGQPTQQISEQASTTNQLAKAVTAFAAGGTILILSALILTLTVIGLAVAVPLLVIFSPVIVPAAITVLLVMGGFMVSGGLGVSAIYILSWLYRYLTGGEHPIESDTATTKIGGGVGVYRDQLTPQD